MEEKTISSQAFTKNENFEIIEKLSEKINGKYIYKLKLKCVVCGNTQIVSATHKERCKCLYCRELKTSLSYVGNVYGTYKILEYVETEIKSYGKVRKYSVECSNCGSINTQALNHILRKPKSCSECRYEVRNLNNPPKIEAVRNCVKSTYITGAKVRGFDFDLTDKEFDDLIYGNCFYCGVKPSEYLSDKKFNKTDEIFERNGIDRINPSLGYSKDNTVSCCAICNMMKMDLDFKSFLKKVTQIHNNLVNEGSTTIPKGSTSKVNVDGNGEPQTDSAVGDDIVSSIW